MTDQLFFDTDCISAFLWVGRENLLLKLYPGRVILPKQVFDELSHPSIPHIKTKIEELSASGDVSIREILTSTEEYKLYHELTISPVKGEKVIGKGEAAAIALSKVHGGIIASNNLKDIKSYVDKYALNHVTTADILAMSLEAGFIDEATGNTIWGNMIKRRRMMPTATFSEYLQKRNASSKSTVDL